MNRRRLWESNPGLLRYPLHYCLLGFKSGLYIGNKLNLAVITNLLLSCQPLVFSAIPRTYLCVRQMAQFGLFFATNFSYHLLPRSRDMNPCQPVELQLSGTFDGHSTVACQPLIDPHLIGIRQVVVSLPGGLEVDEKLL